MADLIGITFILSLALLTLAVSLRFPAISKFLLVALVIRVSLILVGHYLFALPDSTADAVTFDGDAWQMGKDGFFNLFDKFTGPSPHFISWLIGIPYSLFGRSIMMAQSVSLFFGLGSIVLGWLLAKEIWDENIADKVGWTIALFPSLTLYSVLFLREVYIVFFVLLAFYGVATWIKTNSYQSLIISMTGFVGSIFFHGGLIVGALVFLFVVGLTNLTRFFKSLKRNKINLKSLIISLFFILIIQLYLSNKISVPYLGTFQSSTNVENIQNRTSVATRGTASWPEWTTINKPIEIIYKGPMRSIYLVYAPFPWDISRVRHLIGMFDAFLYMYLSYLILRNIKVILKDPVLRIFLLMLLCYIFVFGIGVGNFGTGIRHRSKFVVIFILLAAPFLKNFVFKKTKTQILMKSNTN